MKRFLLGGMTLFLLISCASDRSRGNLDVQTLMTAEESTFLPFSVTTEHIDEIKRWYGVTRLDLKDYTVDLSGRVNVPSGVIYKQATQQKNEKTIRDFISYLQNPGEFGELQNKSIFICGPHLSLVMKRSGILSSLDTTKVINTFTRENKQEVIIEYVVRGDSIPKILMLIRALLLIDDAINVRKFTPMELRWYAAITEYDIEEPVLMFENRYHKICIHFDKNGKVFFIDLFDNLVW